MKIPLAYMLRLILSVNSRPVEIPEQIHTAAIARAQQVLEGRDEGEAWWWHYHHQRLPFSTDPKVGETWRAASFVAIEKAAQMMGDFFPDFPYWELQTDQDLGPDLGLVPEAGRRRPVLAFATPRVGGPPGIAHVAVRPLKKGEWVVIYRAGSTPSAWIAKEDQEDILVESAWTFWPTAKMFKDLCVTEIDCSGAF